MTAADSHLDGDRLIASRLLPAPVDLVWQALTTPEHLAAFWGGDHALVAHESVTVDLRVGGTFALETRPPDGRGPGRRLRFRYQAIDEPDLLVLLEPATGLETTIRLTTAEDGTTITVHQRHLPPELRTEQARVGLAAILDALHDRLTLTMRAARLDTLDRYLDGFRRGDHDGILACLTDDVVWHVHGVRTTRGKAEFDDEIENPAFEGRPELTVDRTLESGDTIVVTGTGAGHLRGGDGFRFVFCDLFTFRGTLLAQVDSYVVPVP